MATSGKGGFRNNGQPRVQLRPGLTRVAQLKAAIREMMHNDTSDDDMLKIGFAAIDGTYIPPNFRPPTPEQVKARAGIIPHDPKDDEPEGAAEDSDGNCTSCGHDILSRAGDDCEQSDAHNPEG